MGFGVRTQVRRKIRVSKLFKAEHNIHLYQARNVLLLNSAEADFLIEVVIPVREDLVCKFY